MPSGGAARLLCLIDTLEIGGAERSLLDILPRLRGVRPTVCHLYPGRTLREAYERAGIPVVSLDLPGRYSFAKALSRVRGLVRAVRPDLIHSTLLRSDLVARAVGVLEGLPVVNSLVNDSYSARFDLQRAALLRAKYRVVHLLDRLGASRVTAFVANSAAVKAAGCSALGVPAERVHVIYRGRDASVFHPPAQAPRRGAGGSLLCVARLREHKGHADLIRALPLVLARRPDVRVTIVGEGPARNGLEKLVAALGLHSQVALPGYSADVSSLLRTGDLFVSASHVEGLPGAVVEAMLTGLPVVLSDLPVHREMIEGGAGVLFPTGDGGALAQAILNLLEDPAAARDLGTRALARARELFDIERVAARYDRFYAEVLQAGRRGSAA